MPAAVMTLIAVAFGSNSFYVAVTANARSLRSKKACTASRQYLVYPRNGWAGAPVRHATSFARNADAKAGPTVLANTITGPGSPSTLLPMIFVCA